MTSGNYDDALEDGAQASTWPLEAEWKLVSGNAEHAVAGGEHSGAWKRFTLLCVASNVGLDALTAAPVQARCHGCLRCDMWHCAVA